MILLMVQKCGDHQLRLVVYPMIYKVLYIPGGAGVLNHQPEEMDRNGRILGCFYTNLKMDFTVPRGYTMFFGHVFIPLMRMNYSKLSVFCWKTMRQWLDGMFESSRFPFVPCPMKRPWGLQALKEVTEDGLFFYLFGTLSLGEQTYFDEICCCSWNPNDLYFWRLTPEKRPFPMKTRVIWVLGLFILYRCIFFWKASWLRSFVSSVQVNQFACQDRFALPFSWRAWNKTPKKCWIYEKWVFIPTRVGIVFVKHGDIYDL